MPTPTPPHDDRFMVGSTWITKRMLFATGLLLVVIASMVYTVRGPVRAYESPRDLQLIYSAARAWLQGGNPYDQQDQYAAYLNSLDADAEPVPINKFDSLYPPTTFVVLAPLAALPLEAAHVIWVTLNSLIVVIGLLALLRIAGIDWMNPRGLLLLAVFLVMGPVHSAVTYGHLSVVVLAVVAMSYRALTTGRPLLSGLLLGAATATKPQLAGLFVIAMLLMGRWRTGGWAMMVLGGLLAIAAVRLHLAGFEHWVSDWRQNLAVFTQNNQWGDAVWGASKRWQLVNLSPILHNFIESRAVVAAISWAVLAGIFSVLVWVWYRLPIRPSVLGMWSVIAVATLLPVYHRYYDTCMLILPMVWCVRELRGPMHRWALCCLGVMTVFIVPSSTIVQALPRWGLVSEAVAGSFLWQAIVLLHQNYLLLVLLGMLLWGLARHGRLVHEAGLTDADTAQLPVARA